MKRLTLARILISVALVVRLSLVFLAGNSAEAPLSGGGDAFAYRLLSDNLLAHQGLSYDHMPTALRAPLYPLFLASGQIVAGGHYLLFVRIAQLLASVLTAILAGEISGTLGGDPAIASAVALAAPTLVYLSTEILTETFAALIVAGFFWAVVKNKGPVWAGAFIGLGMLERFNLVVLAVSYAAFQVIAKKPREAARDVALAGIVALAFVAPWFARNLYVFHGSVFYSTQTGTNLLQGLVTPDGRAQSGDTAKLIAAAGWAMGIETNSSFRATLPAEPELDRRARKAAFAEISKVNLPELAATKLGYFWLSFDQLFRIDNFSKPKRIIRYGGVVCYWILLTVGIVGWFRLRNPVAARQFLWYAILVTALHLPFVMNTRMRAPLVEPVLAILAGVAVENPSHKFSLSNSALV